MLHQISSHWNRLVLSGVDKAPSGQIKRKVELSNQLSMCSFLIGTPVLFFFIFFVPYKTYILGTLLILALCLLIPYWNGKGYYNFTRIVICMATTLGSALFPLVGKIYLFNDNIGMAMYFIPRLYLLSALLAPLLLLDLSEKKKLAACLMINAFFLLGFDWIDSLFGVGFYQKGYESPQYFFSNFYILTNYVFLLSALFYLQLDNKKYEAQIISLNESLDRRVKEKTNKLEDSNINLAAYNLMTSHELKTPLTAVQMITRAMKTKNRQEGDIQDEKDLIVIENCLDEMQTLISSIMNFSKLGDLPANIKMQDMNVLLDEVLGEIELSGIPEHIRIVAKDLPASAADEVMMKQVFTNLLSNAIKYSRVKKKAMIEIGGERNGKENVYYVKDNGIGFSMDEKHNLFKLYSRLHSKAEYEGSGLGLAIVERIIKRHGGKVWAEGKQDEGATFYFSLPVSS